MDLNNPNVTPDARQVVGRLLLNGVEVPFVSCDVDSNGFYSADTFSVVLATSGLPVGFGLLSWWASQTSIEVSISIGMVNGLKTDWTNLIVGLVDKWKFQPARFEVSIEGRDLTGKLIDSKTSEKFANMTTSQVAVLLAKRHGLKPVVTATKTSVGGIYKYDHTHLTDETSEWDLLAYLAGVDGFQVYVKGKSLHYEPALNPKTAKHYVIKYVPPGMYEYPQANCSDDLTFERDLTLAQGVTVQVRSWHKGKAFTVSYPSSTAKGIAPGKATAKRQVYSIVRNGLDHQQALKLAQRLHKQITDHEMRMSGSLPGDNVLMPDVIVRVEGTESGFDQLYFADSVRRTYSVEGGYAMSLTAKNHNPNSMILP